MISFKVLQLLSKGGDALFRCPSEVGASGLLINITMIRHKNNEYDRCNKNHKYNKNNKYNKKSPNLDCVPDSFELTAFFPRDPNLETFDGNSPHVGI